MSKHGVIRGDQNIPRSSLFEGRFGRIFRSLPPASWPVEALMDLGAAMTAAPETVEGHPELPAAAREIGKMDRLHDEEENAGISAGYTYFGQFIDHDITFDPASSLQQQNDPNALVDYRTPRLDLDSLYGRGPDDQPYLYREKRFRLGRPLRANRDATTVRDLPRYEDPDYPNEKKRALIGDKRNDENVIVAQLHAAMLQFHNKLVDRCPDASFATVQQQVRWHYQWLVVNDFLPTICGSSTVHSILPHLVGATSVLDDPPEFQLYKWRNDAFMPIEFSAAAFRFGHSMVRPIYRLNTRLNGGDNEDEATNEEVERGLAGRHFIFAGVQRRGLAGFGDFPERWAIDWSLFFDINGSIAQPAQARVQPAYKIDTSLVDPLGFLPEFSQPAIGPAPPLTVAQLHGAELPGELRNLAKRNLLRGARLGLPSGQAVAYSLGLTPIADENLRVGKAILGDWDDPNETRTLTSIHWSFAGNAPLWYYVLAEAQYEWRQRATGAGGRGDAEPLTLGTIGGRIVAETLIGLLWADGSSYLRQQPNFRPEQRLQTIGGLLDFALER